MRTHENFNAQKKRLVGTKRKSHYSCCSSCLIKDRKDNFHLHEKSEINTKGNLHNIRNTQESMKMHQNESVVLTEEDEERIHFNPDYKLDNYL